MRSIWRVEIEAPLTCEQSAALSARRNDRARRTIFSNCADVCSGWRTTGWPMKNEPNRHESSVVEATDSAFLRNSHGTATQSAIEERTSRPIITAPTV